MRLIDADALGVTDFEIVLCGGDYKELCKTLIAKVESAPTIDAVPVVRCKDCKHRKELRECPMYHLNYERYEWQLDEACDDYTKDDGFCDRGERKDDE